MPMVCPRCSTGVTADALYCPYCSLPKPKAGFAVESPASSDTATSSPKAADQVASKKSSRRTKRLAGKNNPGTNRKVRAALVGVAGLVAVLGTAAYIFVVAPLVHSQGVEPKLALAALEKLQHLPSNDPDVTVDARLTNELDKSRRVGNLVGYKGWTVSPIRGTKTRVLLVFSFREVGNIEQRAEWLADLNANSFTPQTPLAVSILK